MHDSIDIFDPSHYAGVRRPFEVAETLPSWCYTSQAFYDREVERIFRKAWNCIGHQDRVKSPGDYFTLDFVGIPLIVVRANDGKVRCFVNFCRHRGSRIVEGCGATKFLKCPYHAWAYGLDGRLVGTPLFEESDNFRKADYALLPVRLEIWAGLMWINVDPDAPDLHTYLGDLPARCAPYRPDDMVCLFRREWPVAANWKFYYENFNEGYHVPFVHPGSLNKQYVPGRSLYTPEKTEGEYIAHFTKHKGSRGLMEGETGFPRMETLPVEGFEGTFYPCVNPTAMLGFTIDSAWAMELYPHSPTQTTLAFSMLFPRAYTERDDFEEIAPKYYSRFEITLPEDVRAAELQQLGVSSPINVPGRFTPMEQLVHSFDNWLLDRVLHN